MERYEDFFIDATGFAPYQWQINVAVKGLPPILPVPTGLGKTEGTVLAWAWRLPNEEPQHLVYCLPMRTLVRQTVERLRSCFKTLQEKRGIAIEVYELMGGAIDNDWARWPDKPWVLVGTQDQLLSRALNRGYAMNRFEWPVHFGLLNQDCRWIIDEVQLMGPGLWTTAQLDWMRQKRFESLKPCVTTWMSATVGYGFLATVDRKNDGLDALTTKDTNILQELNQAILQDDNQEADHRRNPQRQVDWFKPSNGKALLTQQIAVKVDEKHIPGTLSLVVCNTVDMARDIFQALNTEHKILLTSRFRRQDRARHEQHLIEFEARRRQHPGEPIPDDPGLICVSTQVVEAGLDISAHYLWSELSPWPSVIQRLGRLNRDGRGQDAHAWFWETPKEGRAKQERIGPYEAKDVALAKKLLSALSEASKTQPFSQALGEVQKLEKKNFETALQPKPSPLPRALDVHGLFSTERDLFGGFTDVSTFVRGTDPNADLTIFWREWSGNKPPHGVELDGPELNVHDEGCTITFFHLRDMLKKRREPAWIWSYEDDKWVSTSPNDLCPGMVVMLHRHIGGYRTDVGWTGNKDDIIDDVPPAGPGRALRNDARTEIGYWATLDMHLNDVRREAEQLCDAVCLRDSLRTAVIEAAALHDLGKAHPQWQQTLPAADVLSGGPWAKCPRVVAVDCAANNQAILNTVLKLRPNALALADEQRKRGRKEVVRLRWVVDVKLNRDEIEKLKKVEGVLWAGHAPFRPGMRHEVASALAMWKHYRDKSAPYSALAIYLAAAHHGKVRTVLRAINNDGNDIFGVPPEPNSLNFLSQKWPLDFSVAKDGADGQWQNNHFILTGFGWTGLVADLLGPWRPEDKTEVGVVPEGEPRRLGPFVLAYLEALVRVADWRASENPSKRIKPGKVSHV
ncbi:MAG: CRISPR-associated helicase Cas3' [Actinobacteria bacterium]|nr:CRISPR-associated helicase Cas3' [Actinomycetota bacterium]